MSAIHDMTVGSPTRNILRFAVPLALGYILQQMYLIIDAVIVGRYLGVQPLAAVGASSSISFLIMGFCNGACAGFAIPVAQAFGAKKYSRMRGYVADSIRISLVLAVVLTAICSWYTAKILHIINTPSRIFDDAYIFLYLQFLTIPFTIAYNLLAGFIRALGNSKQPFLILIIASVLNIILDFVLIIYLNMGVEGVGIATMTSQFVAAILCFIYIMINMQILVPRGNERKYSELRVAKLLNNGVPMGLQFSITAIGSIMLQSANNALGTVCVAAFTASLRVKYFFTTVFENIGVAMATYCGQCVGAKDMERVKKGLYSSIKIAMCFFVITAVLILPFAEQMINLFVDSSDANSSTIISYGALYMRINCVAFPLLCLLVVFRYSIQGMGYSNMSMMSGVMEMIARAGVSVWMVPSLAFLGVCYGDPIAWFMADLFLVPAIIYVYKHLKKRYRETSLI